jgi:phytanoyl-CoA hydroxylase
VGLESPIISTRPVLSFNSKFLAKKESFWKAPPHQDWKSIQGSINSMVVWIPLLDIDIKLGALEVISRSHKLGSLYDQTVDGFGMVEEKYRKDELYVPLELKKGDIVLFS